MAKDCGSCVMQHQVTDWFLNEDSDGTRDPNLVPFISHESISLIIQGHRRDAMPQITLSQPAAFPEESIQPCERAVFAQ